MYFFRVIKSAYQFLFFRSINIDKNFKSLYFSILSGTLNLYLCFRERVQLAEQSAKEEKLQREKAESSECNLRFLVEQQAHKIQGFEEKFEPNLVEIMEKKISFLKKEILKLKQDNVYKSSKYCYQALLH